MNREFLKGRIAVETISFPGVGFMIANDEDGLKLVSLVYKFALQILFIRRGVNEFPRSIRSEQN